MSRLRLTKLETAILLRAMAYIEAGQWPWAAGQDNTTPVQEVRDHVIWDNAKTKLKVLYESLRE